LIGESVLFPNGIFIFLMLMFALETINGETIVKAKGIGSKLNYNQFETLINNQTIINI
jgi:hypothetical protein